MMVTIAPCNIFLNNDNEHSIYVSLESSQKLFTGYESIENSVMYKKKQFSRQKQAALFST